ncbi:MAG: C40 family peptidase [Bacteroidia bacterium]|nr:C40 family peptidase [Bacteroidia bacterium]
MNKYGVCALCVVPLRAEDNDRSEMISQLLFGESYKVLKINDKWMQVEVSHDGYVGWLDKKQYHKLSQSEYDALLTAPTHITYELVFQSTIKENKQALLLGSNLPYFDGMNFRLNNIKGIFTGRAIEPQYERNHPHLIKVAMKYLNTPYLWGGRSPFGIDCSGFTQVIYKFVGLKLKRDAYQQAEEGRPVNMISEAKEGDLAFFKNKDGKVTHVGIIMGDDKIIHASGKVRIDKIDSYGIFDGESKAYSHQLHSIRRLI